MQEEKRERGKQSEDDRERSVSGGEHFHSILTYTTLPPLSHLLNTTHIIPNHPDHPGAAKPK